MACAGFRWALKFIQASTSNIFATSCPGRSGSRSRLAVQHLEQRLALSASPLEIESTNQFEVTTVSAGEFATLMPLEDALSTDSGHFFACDRNTSGQKLHAQPSALQGHNGATCCQPTANFDLNFTPQPIPLPGLLPSERGAGTVQFPSTNIPNTPFANPVPEEPGSSENHILESAAAPAITRQSAGLWFLPQTKNSLPSSTETAARNNVVVPSRGREISLRVASIALPERIAQPARAATTPEPTDQSTETEQHITTPRGAQDSPVISYQPGRRTATQAAVSSAATVSQSQRATAVTAAGRPAIRVAKPAGPRESSALTDEARQQVFADWRSRELITLSVLTALATGPLSARSRRSPLPPVQQLPLDRKPKTIACSQVSPGLAKSFPLGK